MITVNKIKNGSREFLPYPEGIFDDDKEGTTYKTIDRKLDVIEDKVIYSAKIGIVQFHHCIITIIGEDLTEKELAVIEGEIVDAK